VVTRCPGIDAALAVQIARMVAAIRKEDLRKVPGVAETLDWAATLAGLDLRDLRAEPETVHDTMICLLKTYEDRVRLSPEVTERPLGRGGERWGDSCGSPRRVPPLARRGAAGWRASCARCATTDLPPGSPSPAMR